MKIADLNFIDFLKVPIFKCYLCANPDFQAKSGKTT